MASEGTLHQIQNRLGRPFPKDPDEAWSRLQSGNALFLQGHTEEKYHRAERSIEMSYTLKDEQHPFATVLCCSDSRVPPEHIFCEGFGALFVVRLVAVKFSRYSLLDLDFDDRIEWLAT